MQLTELAGSAVAVYPAFRRVLGLSASAAQFLSQAVYWTEKTGDGWFYKTESEWLSEVGLGADEVRDSRKSLKAMGVLNEERKGIPAKMFYRIDVDVLFEALEGNVRAATLEQILDLHGSKLGQLSKAGLMRAKRAGVECEYVDYAAVLKAHGMVCGCCGAAITRGPGKTGDHLSFDHKHPLIAGGAHVFSNLQPAHASCNAAKGGSVSYQTGTSSSPVDGSSLSLVETSSSSTQEQLVVLPAKDKCFSQPTTITEITQKTTAETTALVLAPASPKRAAKKTDAGADEAKQSACREIWTAYSEAFQIRYQAAPVRNAKVNRNVVDLWKRLGSEAAAVAEFYVGINDSYLIRNCHDLGSLLVKAESYRTQWATNRQMNATTAQQIERKQANLQAGQEAAQRIMSREGRKENEFL